jgi:sulfate adenylyltransferase
MIGDDKFVEIFVDTPLGVCEGRDTKGMYARARRGEIRGFTGIDDPYERPETAELTIETVKSSVAENVSRIYAYLAARGLVKRSD